MVREATSLKFMRCGGWGDPAGHGAPGRAAAGKEAVGLEQVFPTPSHNVTLAPIVIPAAMLIIANFVISSDMIWMLIGW